MKRTASALKIGRQNVVARERNRIMKSKVHTAKRRLVEALTAKNRELVEEKFRIYSSEVDKAVKKNIFHKNKAARLKSRACKHIKDLFNEHVSA